MVIAFNSFSLTGFLTNQFLILFMEVFLFALEIIVCVKSEKKMTKFLPLMINGAIELLIVMFLAVGNIIAETSMILLSFYLFLIFGFDLIALFLGLFSYLAIKNLKLKKIAAFILFTFLFVVLLYGLIYISVDLGMFSRF